MDRIDVSQAIHEPEQIVAKLYRSLGLHDKLKQRWVLINYRPKNIQLKLWN